MGERREQGIIMTRELGLSLRPGLCFRGCGVGHWVDCGQ